MTYTTWNYAPPNSDGTCPNPDTHMLITSNAPGSCFVDGYPPYTCIQPDPLNEANTFGFNKQTNKDYAICAPSCSSPTDCPPVGADPRSGKNLQGQPNCTFMPNMTEYTVKGHCVITPPIFTQTDPRIPNQHYDECELIGEMNPTKPFVILGPIGFIDLQQIISYILMTQQLASNNIPTF